MLKYPGIPIDKHLEKHSIYKQIVEDQRPAIEVIREWIGFTIFTAFDLAPLFTYLWEKAIPEPEEGPVRHLMILTNDMEIPWGFATNPDDPNFCLADKLSIGYITPEEIEPYEQRMTSWDMDICTEIADSDAFLNEKESSWVLLAVDPTLQGVEKEIFELTDLFNKHQFDSEKILTISHLESPRGRFLNNLFLKRKLRIVHFAGHVTDNGNLKLTDGVHITPSTIRGLRCIEKRRLGMSSPLVFLNGCSSGRMKNPYRKSDQLSTAFAALGAIACVTTRFEVPDFEASIFSGCFYEALLKRHGVSVGHALYDARKSFKNKLENNPAIQHIPYFYCMYGNPVVEIFPRAPRGFIHEAKELTDKPTNTLADMFGKPLGKSFGE